MWSEDSDLDLGDKKVLSQKKSDFLLHRKLHPEYSEDVQRCERHLERYEPLMMLFIFKISK